MILYPRNPSGDPSQDNSGSGSGIKMEADTKYTDEDALAPCMRMADLRVLAKGYHP